MALSRSELARLRHPSEQTNFIISLVVIVPMTLLIVAITFATFGLFVLYLLLIFGIFWLVMKVMIASYLGNLVKISSQNFPEIRDMIRDSKEYFGYDGYVTAYIIPESQYNAYIVPLLRKNVILIDAEVISSAKDTGEVRWIIGRFIGALASKHYRFLWLEAVLNSAEKFQVLNLLLYPYERSVQLSGDQLGLVMIDGDLNVATRTMCRIMAGGKVGGHISVEGVLEQHLEMRGSFFGWIAKCLSPFPHNTQRMANLVRFAREFYPDEASTFVRGVADKEGRRTFDSATR